MAEAPVKKNPYEPEWWQRFAFAVLEGVMIWFIPFAIAVIAYPVRLSIPDFFEVIMPVTLTLTVVFFVNLYLRNVKKNFVWSGLRVGFFWYLLCLLIDLSVNMTTGEGKAHLLDALLTAGLTYLIIPVVTVGFAYFVNRVSEE